MNRKSNIIDPCWEQGDHIASFVSENGPVIPTLAKSGGVKRFIGRKISDVSRYLGSYGMGGPGFFGFEFETHPLKYYPKEWLVLRLWAANQWLLVDGKWLDCHPDHFDVNKCFFTDHITNFSEANKQVKDFFTGLTVIKFTIKEHSFKMLLSDGEKRHCALELPEDITKLPPLGCGDKRQWFKKDKIRNALIVSPTPYINI